MSDGGPQYGLEQHRRFTQIDAHYQDLYRQLTQTGQLPYRHTPLGAWAASIAANAFHFFSCLRLGKTRLFIDLGSGDGVVACIAGLFTRAIGVEIDRALCGVARRAVEQLRLSDQVAICCGDYLNLRIRQADCLYLYPDKPLAEVEELLEDWQGQLLVAGPHFPPKHLKPLQRLQRGHDQLVAYGRR